MTDDEIAALADKSVRTVAPGVYLRVRGRSRGWWKREKRAGKTVWRALGIWPHATEAEAIAKGAEFTSPRLTKPATLPMPVRFGPIALEQLQSAEGVLCLVRIVDQGQGWQMLVTPAAQVLPAVERAPLIARADQPDDAAPATRSAQRYKPGELQALVGGKPTKAKAKIIEAAVLDKARAVVAATVVPEHPADDIKIVDPAEVMVETLMVETLPRTRMRRPIWNWSHLW